MKTFNFMIILVSLLALGLLNFVDFVSCQDPAAGAPTPAPAPAPGTPAPGTPAPAPGTPAPAPGAPAAPGGLIPTTIGTITKEPDLSAVPQSLLVPKGNNFAFLLNARGNQIYQCSAKQWFLTDSDTMLINDKSDLQQHFDPAFVVVHHNITKTPIQGGNYTWNSLLSSDSSQVVAKLVQSVDAQDPKNIPWELYAATFRSDSGKFSNTSYILRINTNGGIAPPANQCGVQYLDGTSNSVSYEADYLFYEGVLPGTPTNQPGQPSESPSTSKTNDGHSTKPIEPGKLSWVAIVGFISVSVISF